MKKIPPLTKKRRSLADLTPDSLAAALYHRELVELTEAVSIDREIRATANNAQKQENQEKVSA